MEQITSVKPLLAVLVSMAVVPILISTSNRPNIRETWSVVAGVVKFLLVLSMLPAVLQGQEIVLSLFQISPGVSIKFRVDGLGMLFALVASFLWIVTTIYSVGYMRGLKEHSQTRFFSFFALALSSTIGVAFSANLLTLYLFYELLSLSTYPLVVHHQDKKSKISGRKYLGFILGTSIGLVLPAMIVCYHLTGTLEFSAQGIFTGQTDPAILTVLLLLFLFGFAKAAIIPLHSWLPAAMIAPTPVSALLHAVAVVKVGVFSIVRVVTGIFGIELMQTANLAPLISYIAAATIIISSLIAMSQDELKRRLAFSTISQLSYIVLGLGLLVPQALVGGIIHILMHAFAKITLFFCAGAIMVHTGKKYISQLDGIGKVMPITMTAFFIGSLGVIGLPPCGGFISKWYLVLGTLQVHNMLLLTVILTSSFLNAVYFLPIVYRGFLKNNAGLEKNAGKEPLLCVLPLVITAAGSIILFFYAQPFLELLFAQF